MNGNRKITKIRPRPFRLAGYLLWIVIMAAMYVMFRSFLLLFFTGFLVLFPVVSIAYGWLLARQVQITVYVPAALAYRVGDEVVPAVYVYNRYLVGTFDISMDLRIVNSLFDRDIDIGPGLKVSLPVIGYVHRRPTPQGRNGRAGRSDLRLPLTAVRIGSYSVMAGNAAVQDWLGIVKYYINEESRAEFTVLPEPFGGEAPDPETVSSGMTEVEESLRRGNDFSEVTEIREYIPGDRIRDIHWKLSARQEEWMVKVRTQMAGMELVIVMDLDDDESVSEDIISFAYRELYEWIKGETDLKLRVYSSIKYGFDSYVISSTTDVDDAFSDIFDTYYRSRIAGDGSPEALAGLLYNLYPYQGGYIRFGRMKDGTIDWEPVEGVRA